VPHFGRCRRHPLEKESTHVTHCHPEARFFRAEGPRQFIAAHGEERTTGVLRPKYGLRMTVGVVLAQNKSG